MTSKDVVPAAAGRKPRVKKEPDAPALNDTLALINAITKASRDPTTNIETMRFLLETRRTLMLEQAEAEWRDAMALVQAEIEPINRDLANPITRSRYSSLNALDRALRPIYSEHGFVVTFNSMPCDDPPQHLMVFCHVSRGKHRETSQVPMPLDGKGARGGEVMSKTHAMGSAVSYGRRYTLCMAFNLITADDDGNRASGYQPPRGDRADNYVEPRAEHTRRAMENATPSLAGAALEASLEPITEVEVALLRKMLAEAGKAVTGEQVLCEHFSVEGLKDLTHVQYDVAINQLKAKAKEMRDAQ